MTPTLYSETVILKPLSVNAVKQYIVDWLNDKEVTKLSELRHQAHTLAQEKSYVRTFNGESSHLWGIYAADHHVGNISAHIDMVNNVADVGILIGARWAWNKGYGRQAWKAVCDWLLAADGGAVRKVEAGCMETNAGMRRIFAVTGMQYEGERKLHHLVNGQAVSAILVGRFR